MLVKKTVFVHTKQKYALMKMLFCSQTLVYTLAEQKGTFVRIVFN